MPISGPHLEFGLKEDRQTGSQEAADQFKCFLTGDEAEQSRMWWLLVEATIGFGDRLYQLP